MAILRIEALTYGVEDIPACVRFFDDAGFEQVSIGASEAVFRTPENQYVHFRRHDDGGLPAGLESGSTLRETVWGVEAKSDLEAIGGELSRDRPVRADSDGTLHSHDMTGFAIAFRVAHPKPSQVEPRRYNVGRHVDRLNEPLVGYGRARPMRIVHLTLNIPAAGKDAATDFYTERLKFRVIDRVMDNGTFMQCPADMEHHNLFLCHRPNKAGINHIALEVRDLDEVMEGGNYMIQQGWKESRRLGRHTLGSNFFRFIHAPCGGRIEFAADMDRMDAAFKPRVWEKNPPHHIWMLKSSGPEEGHGGA